MALSDLLKRIEELKERIHAKGKLPEEALRKFQYKMRLDWNYHSNAMEGNSLTREETRSVMINNITVEGKPLQDVLDMRGHDEVVTDILRMGKGELNISEKRILQIHKTIIHEDDPAKRDVIGKWKTRNNYLTNYRGEKFDFADHQDVPEKMHELVNWLNASSEKIKKGELLSPVLLAFEFHLRYVTIHPFLDGNGRTARILMNIILIAFGYPPVIVKLEEKDQYGRYLADVQAYGGSPDLFYEFMCGLLLRSLEIEWDAIEGKDIEELSDILKEIEVWKQQLDKKVNNELTKTPEIVINLYNSVIKEMFGFYLESAARLQDLFLKFHVTYFVNSREVSIDSIVSQLQNVTDGIDELYVRTEFLGFKHKLDAFDVTYRFKVKFKRYTYEVWDNDISGTVLGTYLYSQSIDINERRALANEAIKSIFREIKEKAEPDDKS